jgi:hypothetical protein
MDELAFVASFFLCKHAGVMKLAFCEVVGVLLNCFFNQQDCLSGSHTSKNARLKQAPPGRFRMVPVRGRDKGNFVLSFPTGTGGTFDPCTPWQSSFAQLHFHSDKNEIKSRRYSQIIQSKETFEI